MYQFSEDAIREAAYYIWKNNGCQQGTSLSDWDAAINQLSAQAAFSRKVANKFNSCSSNAKKAATKKVAAPKAATKKSATSKASSLHAVKSIVLNPISALKSASANKAAYKNK